MQSEHHPEHPAPGPDDLDPGSSPAPLRFPPAPATPPGLPTAAPENHAPHDAGQTTAEYALVLLGAAAVAGVLIRWATGSAGLTKLFAAVLSKLIRGISG